MGLTKRESQDLVQAPTTADARVFLDRVSVVAAAA
jgi:hypothetical protein